MNIFSSFQIDNYIIYFLTGTLFWVYFFLVAFRFRPLCTCTQKLQGKVVILTGATDGVGKITAFKLAQEGATLILPCRNLGKGNKIKQQIFDATQNMVQILYLDFSNLKSVKTCAAKIKSIANNIDLIINNAGIGDGTGFTSDNIPLIFGVNYIGPFCLTFELLSLLKKSHSRIIFVSSVAHFYGKIEFEKLLLPDEASVKAQFFAYSNSKFAQIVLMKHLARTHKNLCVVAGHPEWSFTSIFRNFPPLLKIISYPFFSLFLYTAEEGAQTQIHLALCKHLNSGSYYVACKSAEYNKKAEEVELGNKLWNYSIQIMKTVLEKTTSI